MEICKDYKDANGNMQRLQRCKWKYAKTTKTTKIQIEICKDYKDCKDANANANANANN
jgi:hypothetical protein